MQTLDASCQNEIKHFMILKLFILPQLFFSVPWKLENDVDVFLQEMFVIKALISSLFM